MKSVWDYFEEITRIPRPSGKEGKIRAYLQTTAKELGFESKVDSAGNVLIRVPASAGRETEGGYVLQAHMDMVCEKNAGMSHDFENDPIKHHTITEADGDWIVTEGTTLGADDGIGIALILSLIADTTVSHPKLECLFTVDEEVGLLGATNIDPNLLTCKEMINLDSEEWGEFCIGCAGGRDTIANIKVHTETPSDAKEYYKLIFSGGKGGHSGEDIHRGRSNAIQQTALAIEALMHKEGPIGKNDLRLVEINGGNLRNAIPRSCEAIIAIEPGKGDRLTECAKHRTMQLRDDFEEEDKDVMLSVEKLENTTMDVMSAESTKQVIDALTTCPHGVLRWEDQNTNMVRTSANLAAVHTNGDEIVVETSQRSSVENEKEWAAQMTADTFLPLEAKIEMGKDYPGWAPNWQSPILKRFTTKYKELFGTDANVKVIHAGLECGVFLTKYKDLDMISLGPSMTGVHSPSERLHKPSVEWSRDLVAAVISEKGI